MKIFFASLVALSALAAQDATNQPKFEVASVKRTDRCSPPTPPSTLGPSH
jgi:hypothetical protein